VVVGFHRQIVAGLFAAIIIGLIIAFLFLWRFVGRMIRARIVFHCRTANDPAMIRSGPLWQSKNGKPTVPVAKRLFSVAATSQTTFFISRSFSPVPSGNRTSTNVGAFPAGRPFYSTRNGGITGPF
jgi:hypothetical protein